jgi:hypothetical protein
MTHADEENTLRYLRLRSRKIAAVAEARSRKRAAENGGGTT